ncbi:hypothetical protein [Arthrobacter sp. P2b]|uniref:hypothetical protein n=1 Tax=Arthrobacter sp. P2b TaxID=1938741 RepID=UPI0009A8F74D|nr:hypothetical protein [Arthrobacter sp. P2b]SLK13878.1 hypothetical protein SAMN06272721_11960 [Arthrobacter sp. P2b]
MASPTEFLGPILELMTWVGVVPGVPLLIIGWIIRKRRCNWSTADGEVFTAGRYRGLQWTDNTSTSRRGLLEPEQAPELQAGHVAVLHYDICHPTRWRLEPPRYDNTATVLGLVLTGVGMASAIAGFVLMML